MGATASQITRLMTVYSIVHSGVDQSKCQGSASLTVVRVIHRCPLNSPHRGSVTRKMFPFHDIMNVHLLDNIMTLQLLMNVWMWKNNVVWKGLTLGMCPANERRRYFVTTSPITRGKPRITLVSSLSSHCNLCRYCVSIEKNLDTSKRQMNDLTQWQRTKLIVQEMITRMACPIPLRVTKCLMLNTIIRPQGQLLLMAYNSRHSHRSGIASYYVAEYLWTWVSTRKDNIMELMILSGEPRNNFIYCEHATLMTFHLR